jgi:hypothetical protein
MKTAHSLASNLAKLTERRRRFKSIFAAFNTLMACTLIVVPRAPGRIEMIVHHRLGVGNLVRLPHLLCHGVCVRRVDKKALMAWSQASNQLSNSCSMHTKYTGALCNPSFASASSKVCRSLARQGLSFLSGQAGRKSQTISTFSHPFCQQHFGDAGSTLQQLEFVVHRLGDKQSHPGAS